MRVEFQHVDLTLGNRPILRDLSLIVEQGESLVLLGASGSGKTTALRLVNGLLFPDRGAVLVDGRPTTSWDLIDLRRKIGYVIQENGLFPHMTVARNVGIVPSLLGWPADTVDARTNALLDEVQLTSNEYRDRYPHQLSGGQRQRVGVARALAADPGLLLLDEPFGALDPLIRVDLQRQFEDLRSRYQKTSILVTHDVREALRLGSHIGLIDAGQLVAFAPVEDFQKLPDPRVRAFLNT